MSSLHSVRFFIYGTLRFTPQETQQLVSIAYQTARDRKLFPMEVLIRSGVHSTTKINGKYKPDPQGPHVTLCFKTEDQIQRGTHVASHGYVKSNIDWTYTSATHHREKRDNTKKAKGEEVWPATEDLTELPTIEYGLSAEAMTEWARTAEGATAISYNRTLDFSLTNERSAGETSQAGGQHAQKALIIDVGTDTYAEVEAKESHYFRVKLLDGSTIRTEASRWQSAYAWYNDQWLECFLYVSLKSGTRYWTWILEPEKSAHKSSHKKGKGRK